MNTMKFGNITCTFEIDPDFVLASEVALRYVEETPDGEKFTIPCGADAVRYAVERYMLRSTEVRRDCCYDSWHIRLAKGKGRRPKRFSFVVPAAVLDLPGRWVRISGQTDEHGAVARRVELLRTPPKERKK